MAGRGVGRGTAFGRGIRFEALPDSAATGASQAAGRGFPIHRAAAQPAQPDIAASVGTLAITTQTPGRKLTKDGEEQRARGDFDVNRPSYRIPKRFKDNFPTERRRLTLLEQTGGKEGSEGSKVALKANYFHVRSDKTLTYTLAVFSVQFSPVVEYRQERLGILREMEAMKKVQLGFFYDGKAHVFVPTQYHKTLLDGGKVFQDTYKHLREGKVTLVYKGDYGRVKDADDMELGTAHGVINDVLSEILTGDDCGKLMLRIEDGFFRQDDQSEIRGLVNVPFKLSVWPGYLPLVKQFDAGLLLNLDLCNRFIRTGTVLDCIKKISGPPGSDEHAKNCEAVLKNMIVLTKYNDMAYKIYEVTYKKNVDSKFERKVVGKNKQGIYAESSTNYTIREYIKMMYGAQPDMEIKNLTQPILECFRATGETPAKKPKGEKPETVSIVPELALLTGLTDDLRTNFSNMNKILDSVRKEPGKRGEICRQFALGLSNHPKAKEKMAAWAMTMDASLLDLEGRELPTVHLAQAGNKTVVYDRVDADWTRNLRGNKLDEAGVMNNITVFYSQQDKNKAGDFYTMLGKVGAPMGMKFVTPKDVGLAGDSVSFRTSVDNMEKVDMVLCVLPDNKKERYEGIKQLASNKHGMPSQCILSKNMDSKSAMSIATKLAMQMNAKLGGALWHIKDPAIKGPGVAVVGVVLGRAMNFKGHKMASFVGTVNDNYNKFYNVAKPVTGMEVEEAYTEAFSSIAERHTCFNGASMNKIIVYRQIETDDDMFLICDKTNGELGYAKKAAKNLDAKLVYVVAVKRCSSRFFGGSMGNPRPGTVIDQDVTLPNRFDFYMVSHAGRKGSVMPTYYFIVHDDLDLPPNVLQQFTFQMCHMYYNWSGTIKVPAVCQYAFKQAVMCGEVTKMAADKRLYDKLWFL